MADFYVTADRGSEESIAPVAKGIESEGFTTETGETGPDAEHLRNDGIVKPPTKLVFICNGGQAGQTYASFAQNFQEGMAFTIFAFDNYATHFDTTTEDAVRNTPLVSEWDSGSFATESGAQDIKGHTTCSYQEKYPNIFAFIADEQSAENMGKRIAKGDYTCGSGGSTPQAEGGSAQIKDKTFENCIRRICAATDSVFLVENNAAVLFPYTDWMAFTLRQKINKIQSKEMDPDLFSIEYNNEGFYNKVTTVYGADESTDEQTNNTDKQTTSDKADKQNEEEKTTKGNTTKTRKSMPTGGTQLSEQYDPLVKIYGELEKKVTTNFPDEETAQYVTNALLIQYIRDFNNSCRARVLNNRKFMGGTFYAVENPNTKESELFYLNSYTMFKAKDQPLVLDMEFKYGPEGAEELLDYQAYGGGGSANTGDSSAEEQIWKDGAKIKYGGDNSTEDPEEAWKMFGGKEDSSSTDCYGMSAYLYYRFNNQANIPCRVVGDASHHVVMLYKNNQWKETVQEYRDYKFDQLFRWKEDQVTTVLLEAKNPPSGSNASSTPSGDTSNQSSSNGGGGGVH